MSVSVSDLYWYARLAQAAYVRFGLGQISSVDATREAVAQERLAQSLADQMFGAGNESWAVFAEPFHDNDSSSGFAATLFRGGTGEKVLAIRGTETSLIAPVYKDLLKADFAEIGFLGIALSQVVDLFNYVERLRAPASDERVLQVSLRITPAGVPPEPSRPYVAIPTEIPGVEVYYWLEARYDGRGLSALALGERLTVTGHSLGGHLAAVAARLFPELVSEAVTFNSPGFNPPTARLADGASAFLDLFREFGARPAPSFAAASPIYTIEGEDSAPGDDISVVSGIVTGLPASPEIKVTTEKNSHGRLL
jgi:hypothetical protein